MLQRCAPACPVHLYLHLLCPGCGSTRATLALLHGDLSQAWHFNALFVTALPLLVAYAAVVLVRYCRDDTDLWPRIPRSAVATMLLASATFTLLRNL